MRSVRRIGFLTIMAVLAGCSIPNFDTSECRESRTPVKEFYSYHFGNDMAFSPDNLTQREKFLSTGFVERLRIENPEIDPFTKESEEPKAFRVGECKTLEPGKRAIFQIVLFWRDDEQNREKIINAEAVKQGEEWRVDRVE